MAELMNQKSQAYRIGMESDHKHKCKFCVSQRVTTADMVTLWNFEVKK